MKPKIALLDASLGESRVRTNFNRELESDITYFKVSEGKLPDYFGFDGILVSGSSSSVNEEKKWMNKTIKYIKKAHKRNKFILGICWGHQLIAKALGGKVTELKERNIGYREIKQTKKGKKDKKLFKDIPSSFLGFITHQDHIKELPKGSKVLAKRKNTIQDFKVKDTYGVQFHPEYDLETAIEVSEKYLSDKELKEAKKSLNRENERRANEESGKVLRNYEETIKNQNK